MDANEKRLIEGLFARLGETSRTAPPPEIEADAAIRDAVRRLPSAPYYMAQTILVQDHALAAARTRIEALEARVAALEDERESAPSAPTRGGFLSGLLGREEPAEPGAPWGRRAGTGVPSAGLSAPRPGPASAPAAYASPAPYAAPSSVAAPGGGFLAGAAQTAVGVAGGVMLGPMLGSLFGAHHPFGGLGSGLGAMPADVTTITDNVFVEQPDAAPPAADAGSDLQQAEFQPGNADYYQEASADLGTDPGIDAGDQDFGDGGFDQV